MRRLIIFILALLIGFSSSVAQKIRIVNKEYEQPVSDVFVYNKSMDNNTSSDNQGLFDLSIFDENDSIVFQHPAFRGKIIAYRDLLGQKKVILTEKIITFDEVVVAANKFQQSRGDIAQDIISLKGKKIEFTNPQTSADLLENSGQVYVQKSQYGGGSPTLRGFAANSVLLVIDGVRLNNGIYRSGNLQNVINIDPNAIARTEVIFGPGSVMYGSDALGGVMDFTTKSPVFSTDNSLLAKGTILSRYGTAANEKSFHADVSISNNKIGYFGSFSYSDFGDLMAGSNRSEAYEGHFLRENYVDRRNGQDILIENENPNLQKFTGYNLQNTVQKLSFRLGDDKLLTYGFYHSTTSDIPRYDRLTIKENNSDTLENAEWYYGPQKWLMHSLSFNSYSKMVLYDQMKITASYQDYEESRNDRDFGDPRLRTRTETVGILTGSVDFEKQLNRGTLYYGVDGFYNNIESDAFRRNINTDEKTSTETRYPDGGSTFSSAAVYGNYRLRLTEKVNLTTGIRFNQVWLTANTNDAEASVLTLNNLEISNQAITGSAGLIYTPKDSRQINFLLSSGFRSPNIDDIGKVFELNDELIVVPNPNLSSEYVYSGEISIREQLSESLLFEIVTFGSLLNNAIVRDEYLIDGSGTIEIDGETKQIRAQVNASKAYIYGGSARVKAQFTESLALSTVISINEGFEAQTREPLRHVTPVFGQTSLSYQKKDFSLDLVSDYHFARSPGQIADSEFLDKPHLYTDDGSPGWITLDIRSGYRLFKNFDLEGGIENIFDQHYRTYSSGISAPGRNFYLTAKFSF